MDVKRWQPGGLNLMHIRILYRTPSGSQELVSILWGKPIFWSKPELGAKNIQYKDLYLKVPHNSEADFFFFSFRSEIKGDVSAGSSMFPENAPPLCKVYYESWRGHAETSGQGLLAERRQEEAKAHLGDSSEVGKSRQREAQSYGLGQSTRRTSFVRDCSDSEFRVHF